MTAAPFPVAWITGASSGIGRALALRLARAGCGVAASARSADALASLVTEADGLPGSIAAFPVDVADRSAVGETYAKIRHALGVPDLCVLNAGTSRSVAGPAPEAATFREVFDVNLMGTVHALEAAVPDMAARGSGRIAIVASVAGYRGLPTAAAYGASKAALIHLAETLHMDLRSVGIRVQVVNPGFVATPITARNDFPMPFLMSADRAAERIYRGLSGRRFEIAFPRRFTWLVKAARLLPAAIYLPLVGGLATRRISRRRPGG